ncbi:MAG: hypothetical protein WC654_03875 [Patescibacteria group bacterium]
MSDIMRELRAAAEPYKSFPVAVAALVRAAFDRGATQVRISYSVRQAGIINLSIRDDGRELTQTEQTAMVSLGVASRCPYPGNIGLTFVHHAGKLRVANRSRGMEVEIVSGEERIEESGVTEASKTAITFWYLGAGNGVNAKQDRSAKRLVRELPRLLSPREAQGTTVMDETFATFSLTPQGGFDRKFRGGYAIDRPGRMVGYGTMDGLVLKYGPVRVSLVKFLSKVHLNDDEHERLNILTSPWARGTIELTPTEEGAVPIPTTAAEDFDNTWYEHNEMFRFPDLNGGASALARALLDADLPEMLIHQMGKLVVNALSEFASVERPLTLGGKGYQVSYATPEPEMIKKGEGLVLWEDPTPFSGYLRLLVDATHPVFRTVNPIDEEIMQILWWQIAMWIDLNRSFIEKPDLRLASITRTYLALRRENPRRDWDE